MLGAGEARSGIGVGKISRVGVASGVVSATLCKAAGLADGSGSAQAARIKTRDKAARTGKYFMGLIITIVKQNNR
jgi:hypothetical protein